MMGRMGEEKESASEHGGGRASTLRELHQEYLQLQCG